MEKNISGLKSEAKFLKLWYYKIWI